LDREFDGNFDFIAGFGFEVPFQHLSFGEHPGGGFGFYHGFDEFHFNGFVSGHGYMIPDHRFFLGFLVVLDSDETFVNQNVLFLKDAFVLSKGIQYFMDQKMRQTSKFT
jgi:hypothetical protein